MKKILLIATGGTIASVNTPDGMKPALDGAQLIEYVPELQTMCEIDIIQLMQLDSTNIQPNHWVEMAHAVADNYDKYDGFVITHGTDTMAYSGAALYYMLENLTKPVVLTGSQLSLAEDGSDAPANLITSFRAAASDLTGVYIAFYGKVMQGNAVKKLYTEQFDAFHSINVPDVAKLENGILKFNDEYKRENIAKKELPLIVKEKICRKVVVLEVVPGLSGDVIKMMADSGCKGIILKAYGAGGIPEVLLPALTYAKEKGVRLIGATQSIYDGVHMDRYEVGISALKCGVEPGGDLTTEALLVKLMLDC